MSELLKQKSFEMSYALFQIARLMKQKDLRGRIEANAISLLESAEHGNILLLNQAIAVLRKLVILGEGVGEVHYEHSRTINRQFVNLSSAISDYVSSVQDRDRDSIVDIDSFFKNKFSDILPVISGAVSKSNSSHNTTKPSRVPMQDLKGEVNRREGKAEKEDKRQFPDIQQSSKFYSSRQSAVYEKIKQFALNGKECHMKDLIAAFPEVSERTLRYDLQGMSLRGIIERVGNGGPFSYYRPKGEGVSLLHTKEISSNLLG